VLIQVQVKATNLWNHFELIIAQVRMKTFALLFLVFSLAECQSRYNHVVTTGYSKTFNTFSFFDSNLDQPRESEAEDNLTFMTYDEELEQLFAVHEVVTYESNNTAAVSR
jgi:hypothetical protein